MSSRWFPGIDYPERTDPHIPALVDGFRAALDACGECVIRPEHASATVSPRCELFLDVSHPAHPAAIRIETGDGWNGFEILGENTWWERERIPTDLDWAVACVGTFDALLNGRNENLVRRRRGRYVGSTLRGWDSGGAALPEVSLQRFRNPLLATLTGPDVSWEARRIELRAAKPVTVLD